MSCFGVAGAPRWVVPLPPILDEEWEHHRYAVRDLDAIEARSDR